MRTIVIKLTSIYPKWYDNTQLKQQGLSLSDPVDDKIFHRILKINDNRNLTPQQRCKKLETLGKKHNISFVLQ